MRPIFLLTPFVFLMACDNSDIRFGDDVSTDINEVTERDFAVDIMASSPIVDLSYTTSELEDGEWIDVSIPMEDMGNGDFAGTLVIPNASTEGTVSIDGSAGPFPFSWKTVDSDELQYSVTMYPSALDEPVWMGYQTNDDLTVTLIFGWDVAELK